MVIKLFDSEIKVMDILWDNGDTTAKEIAEILHAQVGWSKTTTYTVIKKCMDKGAIDRSDPNFVCHAQVTREQAQALETRELIDKLYNGSEDQLIASLLGGRGLTPEGIEKLRHLVREMEDAR